VKRIVKTKCINNKWIDFGNHTGFNNIERTCDNLIVGEWYELVLHSNPKFGYYELVEEEVIYDEGQINGYKIGKQFTNIDKYASGENIISVNRFSNFFLSEKEVIEELRDLKIKEILE
jgi:hypothetical protein